MGHGTSYRGEIAINNKKALALIRHLIDNDQPPFDEWDYGALSTPPYGIEIDGELDSKDGAKKLCAIIVSMDKTATGFIEAQGDDREDNWKMSIENGMVLVSTSKIVYNPGVEFQNKESHDTGQSILNDEELWIKIIGDKI